MLALAAAIALVLPAPEPVAIRHVSVINVVDGRIQKDMTVLLMDGTITTIGKKVPVEKARAVDGTGKFLIPGLWDMHVHCCNADDHFFPLFLANGVTGIRDMADPLDELKTCRTNVENGTLLGPRMVFSGPIVDGPKPIWPDISIAVGTPEEGRKAVETVQQGGADFVKVYSLLPRDAYFAIADEAKKRHIVFAGHVPNLITATEASDAGQKSFEHLLSVLMGCSSKEAELMRAQGLSTIQLNRAELDSYDPAKAKALFTRFRKNGTWQCPTLTVLNAMTHLDATAFRNDPRLSYLPDDIVSFWNPTNNFYHTNGFSAGDWQCAHSCFAMRCELVGMMARSGVGILAGTDTPNPGAFPGFGIHDELALLVKCGLTPLQALQTATINPARFFGWEQKMGTVQVGKVADLVLLDANPLEDIRNAAKIDAVFARGRYLDRATLDQMLKHKSDSAALPSHQLWGLDNGD
jgi:imidazolonepropionase-like amidohydrolase